MQAQFERFSITLTKDQALYASHPGNCDQEVADLVREKKVARMLSRIKPDDIRAELREYGAWDDAELANNAENQHRIVWIAAGNISEELAEGRA